jgi:uncharacterized protein
MTLLPQLLLHGTRLLGALAAVAFLPTATAASFDCTKAGSAAERAICADAALSAMDDDLSALYAAARREADDRGRLQRQQRHWLERRNACPDAACLRQAYRARLDRLRAASVEAPARDWQCPGQPHKLLLEALTMARSLPAADPGDSGQPRDFDDLRSGYSRLIPDIAVALAMAGCDDDALRALGEVSAAALREEAAAHVAAAFAERGKIAQAVELAKPLKIEEAFVQAKFAIARAHVRAGNPAAAAAAVAQVTTRERSMASPVYMLTAFMVEADRIDEALAMLAKFDGPYWNARYIIAQAQAKKGDTAGAERQFAAALAEARGGLVAEHVRFMWAMLRADTGDTAGARELAMKIGAPNRRTQALVYVAMQASSPRAAREVLQQAWTAAQKCSGQDCWVAQLWVAEAYAGIGELERAKAIGEQVLQKAPGMGFKLVAARASLGDIEGARRLVAQFASGGPSADQALMAIAIAEARDGAHEAARADWLKIPNPSVQATVVIAVAAETPPSEALLAWLESAAGIKSVPMQARAIQPLLAALVRHGDAQSALSWLSMRGSALEPLTQARARLGISQGLLGISPGREWLKHLKV